MIGLKITASLSLSEGVLFFIRGLWRTNGDKTRICVSYKDEYFTTAKDEHLMKNKEDNFPILAMIDCYF